MSSRVGGGFHRNRAVNSSPARARICAESVSGSKGLKRTASTPRSAKRRWSVPCTLAVSNSTGIRSGGRVLAQFAKGRGTVHSRHHHVEQDGVRLMLRGAGHSLRSGAGHDHFPSRHLSRLNAATSRISSSSSMIRILRAKRETLQNHCQMPARRCRWGVVRLTGLSNSDGCRRRRFFHAAARNAAWLAPELPTAAAARASWRGNMWGPASVGCARLRRRSRPEYTTSGRWARLSCWRSQSTTLKPSPSGSPISSTIRCGSNAEQAAIVSWSECAVCDGNTVAGKHLADHARQVAIVLDNQNAGRVTGPA